MQAVTKIYLMHDFTSTSKWEGETVLYFLSYHLFLRATNSRDTVCTRKRVFLFYIYRTELLGLSLIILAFLENDCNMAMLSSEAVVLTFSYST